MNKFNFALAAVPVAIVVSTAAAFASTDGASHRTRPVWIEAGLQLTGPGAHNNVAPFPGMFSPGHDDRVPGLVVLTSTTIGSDVDPTFSGPGTNLANLFNLTGITNRDNKETELWDTWIVGKAIAGQNVDTTLTVAVVDDLSQDGVFNDAPNVVPDLNQDGRIDARDLELLGVVSNIVTVPFRINGAPPTP